MLTAPALVLARQWVSAVLIANNVCSENLLRLILHRFDELDADKKYVVGMRESRKTLDVLTVLLLPLELLLLHSGFLDEKDIEILQAQKSQAAA